MSFSQHPSSKTGIFEDGLYVLGLFFKKLIQICKCPLTILDIFVEN
jgi:hypothetical protein